MRFNVNDKVRVRLTEHGKTLHREDHAKFWAHLGKKEPPYISPGEDENGWSEWQMWALMQDFGPHMTLGSPVPFETEIEIPCHKSE